MNKIILLFFFYGLIACKKNNSYRSDNTATINVINGVVNSPITIKMNGVSNASGGTSSSSSLSTVSYGSSAFFYAVSNTVPIQVLKLPDSSLLLNNSYNLKTGGIYTLLLAGIVPNVEGVLIDDSNLPYVNLSNAPSAADSIINIRFINLVSDLSSVDVRLQGAVTYEVSGLAYKTASSFKAYTAKLANASYKFEFVENGVVRSTSTLNVSATNRFRNVALVLRGMKSPATGQPSLSVSTINYFQ